MSDAEMIELLRSRDQRGLALLQRHYGPLMHYIAAPILPNKQEQEECLADVSMQVWEKIHTFDPARGSFPTWLTRVTRNTALNRARRAGPEHQELTPDIPAPNADPEQRLLQKEALRELRTALAGLTGPEQALLYRKYYYRQSTAQIARELGTTERAIEGRLYRLKGKLKTILGGAHHG